MSAVVLLGTGLALLLLPGALRPVGRRLPPVPWTALVAAALTGGLLAFELALVLVAAPDVLRAAGLVRFAELCSQMLHLIDPAPQPLSWLGAGLAVAVPASVLRAVLVARRNQRRAAVEPWLGDHADHGGYEVVVLPTPQPLAFSVAGPWPQVVLSSGLAASLPRSHLEAVVRHEAAHVRHRHHRYLLLARGLEAALGPIPGIRASVGVLRTGLERWADEEAAAPPSARPAVLDALVQVGHTILLTAVPQFGPAETVAERLDALRRDPPAGRSRLLLAGAPLLALGGLALWSLASWVGMAKTMLAGGGYCMS